MITKYAPNGFAETRDRLSWVLIYAPDFKGRFTLDEAFEDLEHGVGTVRQTLKDAERLAILDACLTKLCDSKAALQANDIKRGKQLFLEAEELFLLLRRPKPKPESKGEDPGESAEDTVDD